MKTPKWHHDYVLPIIYEIINNLCKEKKDWISNQEIVNEPFNDRMIMEKQEVSNMAAWFSQKITEFEKGTLSNTYSVASLIRKAYQNFDRNKKRNHAKNS